MMGIRLHISGNVDPLTRQLAQIWHEIPQKSIRVLYRSMSRRDIEQYAHLETTSSRDAACIPARATRGLLATDHVILNHGQVTWTKPELAPPSPNYHTTPHQREDVSALDRYNVHRCPTRRVFSGTGLELLTRQATVRYLYHSATAATTTMEH
ncbi:uncharacterized protein TNCV_4048661 [Trichonephila clavipes]|nr:uncharacterized protein TNCV_4048661 [Trichonephila clavipes]